MAKDMARVTLDKDEREKYLVRKDDILFNRTNSRELVGKAARATEDLECVFASYLVRMRVNSERAVSGYVGQLLCWDNTFGRLRALATPGASQANINPTILLRSFLIPVPEREEQRAIYESLDAWDTAIAKMQRLIDAKKRRKHGLMQQLLTGKKRLLGFREKWRSRLMGDMFIEREETKRPDLPLLAITANRGIVPAADLDRKDGSNEDKTLYRRICPDDIGYNTMRMWQGVNAVSSLEGIVSPAYTICTPRQGICVQFMGYLFKHHPVVHLFWKHSQGLVDDTLSLKYHNFARIKVLVPEENEQSAIAEVLQAADAEIVAEERRLEVLRNQKKGMMQKLLTGEVRVKA